MKKFVIFLILIGMFGYGYGTYAAEDKALTEKIVNGLINSVKNKTPQQQIDTLNTYKTNINTLKIDRKIKNAINLYIEMKQVEAKKKLGTKIINTDYQTLPNTNWEEISNYRLGLHNEERSEKGLTTYNYDKDLEMTSYKRADTIKTEKRPKNFHKRTDSDNNSSNYPSMKEWFADLGIDFTGEGTEFSENIGRGYYNTKTNNLTEEIKKQISKTFWNVFMSEKSIKGAHYKTIIMPHYTQIGLGISLDPSTKKYYLVSHYSR